MKETLQDVVGKIVPCTFWSSTASIRMLITQKITVIDLGSKLKVILSERAMELAARQNRTSSKSPDSSSVTC